MSEFSSDEDEYVCVDDYPEHDYEEVDAWEGGRAYLCRRCGAELWEEDDDA